MRKIYLLKTWAWLGEEVIIQAVLISAKMNQQGTAGTNLKTNDRERESSVKPVKVYNFVQPIRLHPLNTSA